MSKKLVATFTMLTALLCSGGCASTGAGADLNETATLQELAAEIDALKVKLNRALKQSATAKIDAATALAIVTAENEEEEEDDGAQ